MAFPDLIMRRGARLFTFIFLGCVVALGAALYLQHVNNLDPCPWCVVQRILFVVIGLFALAGALHRPRAFGMTAYATVIGLLSISGIAAATYHVQLQGDPARAAQCAGSVVERLLDYLALGTIIPSLFQYDGPCTLKPWSMLGLSIPEWSLAAFLSIFIAVALTTIFGRR
ncbi:MAG: disulfide bond formation protein B [Betaproteobacteria bacterium]|nr:disulfide bond formation protein B [Betaproteobacteria bacterium]